MGTQPDEVNSARGLENERDERGTPDEISSGRRYEVADVTDRPDMPPQSRYRMRVDGGRDETFRINFLDTLSPEAMTAITGLLLSVAREGASAGIAALTKLEFIEPDTCEYRFWCGPPNKERLNLMFEMWQRINAICPIRNVDGAWLPWFGRGNPPG